MCNYMCSGQHEQVLDCESSDIEYFAQAFEDMQSQGHRPDVGVYNTLIEVLVRSGSCPATFKAIQLFLAASRQGQFRCSSVPLLPYAEPSSNSSALDLIEECRTRAPDTFRIEVMHQQ